MPASPASLAAYEAALERSNVIGRRYATAAIEFRAGRMSTDDYLKVRAERDAANLDVDLAEAKVCREQAEVEAYEDVPEIAGDVTVHLTHALEQIAAGRPSATFRGTHADGNRFSARADLFAIRCAWDAGCSFEALADGFGAGLGTMNGDWSGIRDSSAGAISAMTKKAVAFLKSIR